MKKIFILFLYLFSLNTKAEDFSDKIKEKLITTSVKILSLKGEHGSGTIIKSESKLSYVLTNQHVCLSLKDATLTNSIGVVIYNKKIYPAIVLKISKISDLCMVAFLNNDIVPFITISNKDNKLGENIMTIGYPENHEKFISIGYIGEGYQQLRQFFYRETSIISIQGASGSGVFNKDGELVGVLSIGNMVHANLSGMVDIKSINEFLKTGE